MCIKSTMFYCLCRIRYTNWVFFSIKLNTSSNICIKSTCIKPERNIGGVNNYMWIWKVRSDWMKGYNRNQCWSWPHYPQLGRPETPMWGNYGTIHQVFRGGRGRAGLRSGQVLRSRLAPQMELENKPSQCLKLHNPQCLLFERCGDLCILTVCA